MISFHYQVLRVSPSVAKLLMVDRPAKKLKNISSLVRGFFNIFNRSRENHVFSKMLQIDKQRTDIWDYGVALPPKYN